VFDTQEWEPVFNVRVADHHTYFVGDDGWGWAAWAHNLYLKADTVAGQVVIRSGSATSEWYISADQTKLVHGAGKAWHPTTLPAGQAEADRLTTLSKNFLKALQAVNPKFSDTMSDKLLLTYGRGYKGDFGPPTAAETAAAAAVAGADADADPPKVGTDQLFFALTSAQSDRPAGGRNGRPRLTWEQATQVFALVNQYQQAASQTGFVPWVAPAKPNLAALDTLKPTNLVAGFALPDPQASVRYKVGLDGKPVRTDHFLGAYYETLLAYQVQAGTVQSGVGPQLVVWWGAVIGSNGSADVISVDPTTGQVTLWDSKARSDSSTAPIQSDTFTNKRRREAARNQAINVIRALTAQQISDDLKTKARASLNVATGGIYLQKTVRYRAGSNTSVVTTLTPVPPGG
jgi:hypothetical protein